MGHTLKKNLTKLFQVQKEKTKILKSFYLPYFMEKIMKLEM